MGNVIREWKPGVPKKVLFKIAGVVWILAGTILLLRGIVALSNDVESLPYSFLIGLSGGLLFYLLVFSNVSGRYIRRMAGLKDQRPCAFSFFSWKSYLVMACMITMGVLASKCHLVGQHPVHIFFLIMSVPLIIAGLRFLRSGITFVETP